MSTITEKCICGTDAPWYEDCPKCECAQGDCTTCYKKEKKCLVCKTREIHKDYPDSLYCGVTCRDKHLRQKSSRKSGGCMRRSCPCTKTWDGKRNSYCCITCKKGTPCVAPYHYK